MAQYALGADWSFRDNRRTSDMRLGFLKRSAVPCVIGSFAVALAAFALGRAPTPEALAQVGLYLSFAWTLLLALGISVYGGAGCWIILGAPLALYAPVMAVIAG